VTPFYEALGPSSLGWAAYRVFHNQLSQYRLASVCFWMQRNAVLQGTLPCDSRHRRWCDAHHKRLWRALLRPCSRIVHAEAVKVGRRSYLQL